MADITLPGSYISVQDFTQSFTGVDPSILKPGELARAILRASGRVNTKCRQTLHATLDTETLQQDTQPYGFAIGNDGRMMIFPKRFPIRRVISAAYFYSPTDALSVIDTTRMVLVPDDRARQILVDGAWYKHTPPFYVQLVYVNGWAVTQLAAANMAGDTTSVLKPQPFQASVQGFLPGVQVEIQDQTPEIATVLSTTGNVVTWTAPLQFGHGIDTMVAPPDFSDAQQATLLLTADLLKTRGIGTLTIKNEKLQAANTKNTSTRDTDLEAIADELLTEFTFYA